MFFKLDFTWPRHVCGFGQIDIWHVRLSAFRAQWERFLATNTKHKILAVKVNLTNKFERETSSSSDSRRQIVLAHAKCGPDQLLLRARPVWIFGQDKNKTIINSLSQQKKSLIITVGCWGFYIIIIFLFLWNVRQQKMFLYPPTLPQLGTRFVWSGDLWWSVWRTN